MGLQPWARDVMTKHRFKQICAAFRPEVNSTNIGDKCHQLRHVINKFNQSARKTFVPGYALSFDKGGHACRSRYCPVRQYNKDKPAKYRVDFFILSDAIEYFICHVDVYQGRNGANVGIHETVKTMPTTQKALANALIAAKVTNDPRGYRAVFTDNRYSSIELAIYIREKFKILTAGTIRKNRKGFNKDLFTMTVKNSQRGDSKLYYDPTYKVAIAQWHDNKVVNVVSTLGLSGKVNISRRLGQNVVEISTEKCIREYQLYMGGVDRGDQIRETGAGFCRKAHFKKWYKKSFFAICDFMLLNSYIAWNLAAKSRNSYNKRELQKHEFYAAFAEELLCVNDSDVEEAYTNELCLPIVDAESPNTEKTSTVYFDHLPNYDWGENDSFRPHCYVCKMEGNLQSRAKSGRCSSRDKRALAFCDSCSVFGHTSVNRNSMFQKVPQLAQKTCYQILHDDYCKGLWEQTSRRRSVSTKHHVYHKLLELYDLPKKKGSRQGGRKV